ncbi:DUF2806 domain-containing protein, partial [Helicobacter typhlonius]|uniref:DUF2806 domain-containing protein n=1 Tax=Helicobacter typhlonius TaxID=76936 RepID=UPI002FE20CAB
NKQSQNEERLQKVIEEAINYFEKQKNQEENRMPFSNINLLNQFIITSQSISNTTIQDLCNKIMSHELVSPGVTPQRIMQILSIISFEDMQKFQIICSMNIGIITDYNNDLNQSSNAFKHIMAPIEDMQGYHLKYNISLDDINELQSIGLIAIGENGYDITGFDCKHPLIYANGKTLYVLWHYKDELPIGRILLTKTGECLFNVMNECEIADGYDVDVRKYMEHYGVVFSEQDMYTVFKTENWFSLSRKMPKRYAK